MTELRVVRRAPEVEEVVDALGEAARALGIEAYLVGGFVRDRLLGSPGRDIDTVVVGEGAQELLRSLSSRFGWGRPVLLERFGTLHVRGDGYVVESVRARRERYDPQSRKPDVEPGTLEEDVWRRDFTVNTLCQEFGGRVLDITGQGLDDLAAGVLRTPLDPSDTFDEDPLRMFRGARFVAQLGFRLAPGVLEAMREQADRAGILSTERIHDELIRLLTSAHARAGMEVLRESGLLTRVLPEVVAMIGVEQSGYHCYDVYDHTLHALDLAPRDPVTRLAVLLHDVGKPPTHAVADDGRHTFHDHPQVGAEMAEKILTRLRFSGEEIRDVCELVRLHLRPIQYTHDSYGDAAVRRLIRAAGPLRGRLLDVARADTLASSYPGTAEIDELAGRMDRLDQDGGISRRSAPLDGRTIMRLAGRGSGPWVGRVLDALTEAMMEGEIPVGDAAAAEAWLGAHPELLEGG
ncbi:MAG TPA: HD domain-containing protein [Candidatus Dormibacteraeota bacterium]|nr:HD domain-containing protein [Candidatus Dormibacteraeota bacterium]